MCFWYFLVLLFSNQVLIISFFYFCITVLAISSKINDQN